MSTATGGRGGKEAKMSRVITFVSLFIAAAIAVPIAQAQTRSNQPKVDPLAVGYLIGQGYTPQQVEAWTVGPCSQATKPAACFGPSKGGNLVAPAKVDPLAVGYLAGRGLSPAEIQSWTVGACSHEVKDATCFAALDQATGTATPAVSISRTGGFHWSDAGIGAGAAVGIVLVLAGMTAGLMISRQNRRRVASTSA
jgi:hypothetical protein